jgi:hypothetical protein
LDYEYRKMLINSQANYQLTNLLQSQKESRDG